MKAFGQFFGLLVTVFCLTRAATVTYIGPNVGSTNNLWKNKANWDSGALPTAQDDVIIAKAGTYAVTLGVRADCKSITIGDDAGSQITLNVLENLVLHGNSSVGVIKSGATIALGGGNLVLNGPIPEFTVEGTLKWSSKNIESADDMGTITIAKGGKLSDISSTGACHLISTTIAIYGDAVFGSSNSPILNMESGKVTVFDGTFSVPANPSGLTIISSANETDGSLLEIKGGSFETSASVKISSDLSVDVKGTVDVKQSSIETTCPRPLTQTCTFFNGKLNIEQGATFLVTRGMHVFQSASVVSGPGTFSIQGPEIVRFTGSFDTGSKLVLKNPSVFYNDADGITYDTIEMDQASLFAGEHSAIVKTLDWRGGKIQIMGELTLDTIQLNPTDKTTPILANGTTFQVNGKWNFLKPSIPLNFVDVVISIGSNAAMTVDQADIQFIHTSGAPNKLIISQGGSLSVSSSCSWESYDVTFSGPKAINIQAGGTMQMTSITMTAKDSATLNNDGSLTLIHTTANFGITSALSGTGQYVLAGTTLNVNNGLVNVQGTLSTDTTVVVTRDLSFPKGADPTVKIASLTVKGGSFQVVNRALDPIMVAADFFTYEGGEIIGNSDNSLQPDITYNFGQSIISGGSNRKLTNAKVQFNGATTFKALGNLALDGVTTIFINNTFNVMSNMELVSDPSDPCNGLVHVMPTGTVVVNGTNQAIVQVNLINEGGIQVKDDGTLTLKSKYTQEGSSSLALSGGSIQCDQAQILSGDVSGYGDFVGDLHISGRVIPLFGPNNKSLDITGSLYQGANGVMLCTLSAIAGNLKLMGSINIKGVYGVYGGIFSVEAEQPVQSELHAVKADTGFATWGSFSGSGFSQVKNANLDATQGIAVNVGAKGISLAVTPMPEVVSIQPNVNGKAGQLVNVFGKNFPTSLTAESVEILFDKKAACTDLKILAPNNISCLTPPGVGTVSVCITVDGRGCFNPTTSFSYALPFVNYISPKTDNTSGGAVLNVYGDGFGDSVDDITVMIGKTPCDDVGIFAPGQLYCTVPPGIGTDLSVVVSLQGVAGTSSKNATFSYAAPRIDYVCPKEVKESDKIRIFGQNFAYKFEQNPNITIKIGGLDCEDPYLETVTPSFDQVTCTVPKGTGSQKLDFTVGKQSSAPITVTFSNGGTPAAKEKPLYEQAVFWVAVLGAALVCFVAGLLIGWRCLGRSTGSYEPVAQGVQ